MTDEPPLPPGAGRHQVIIGDSRSMADVPDRSVHLVITSPPYWQLKDYECSDQIGYDQSFEEYVKDLNRVWSECARVLHPGCRACINVGDQFTRARSYGRYQVLPIHAEVILGMRTTGLDFMGSIIWQKVTTCNPSGGGSVMGSYPFPRNGIVKLDYEYILLFRKPGDAPVPAPGVKDASKLEHQEWIQYFSGHWNFPGQKADRHLAAFPIELPHRLIKMYSFVGDTVLDPFLGSGTTTAAAIRLGRSSIGYEINPGFATIIQNHPDLQPHLGLDGSPPCRVTIESASISQESAGELVTPADDVASESRPRAGRGAHERGEYGSVIRKGDSRSRYAVTHRVAGVEGPDSLRLDDGDVVFLAGARVTGREDLDRSAVEYLKSAAKGRRVVVEAAGATIEACPPDEHRVPRRRVFVRLLNRTLLNGKLIRQGLAYVDEPSGGRFLAWLKKYEWEAQSDEVGVWKK